ncbi:MAG: hypothetical protein H7Y17_17445 [Chlorobia bacterium]|nr:hypothetical protein [Fimbriimonadaceae bacterium]
MPKTRSLILLGILSVVVGGCSSEEAPVVGDNPNSANAGTPPSDVASGRANGGLVQTKNPPGTGRGSSGADLLKQGGG